MAQNQNLLTPQEANIVLAGVVRNTNKTCYERKNVYDAADIFNKYFIPNIKLYFNESPKQKIMHSDGSLTKEEHSRNDLWKDLAIIYMFSRFNKEFDDYKELLDSNSKHLLYYRFDFNKRLFSPMTMIFKSPIDKNTTILNVRGTHKILDWYSDIRTKNTIQLPPNLLHISKNPLFEDLLKKNMSHHGVLQHALNALDDIFTYFALTTTKVEDALKQTLIVYGHSLGAACAVFISLILKHIFGAPNVHCYIIACPKVINTTSELYKANLNSPVNYIHYFTYRDFAVLPPKMLSHADKFDNIGDNTQNIVLMPGVSFRGKPSNGQLSQKHSVSQIRDEHSLLTFIPATRDGTYDRKTHAVLHNITKPNGLDKNKKLTRLQTLYEKDSHGPYSYFLPILKLHEAVLIKMPYEALLKRMPTMIRLCAPSSKGGKKTT